jgi:hypothetical protein
VRRIAVYISEDKKHEYWNHFVTDAFTTPRGLPTEVTGARLRKIKPKIWNDLDFWQDIILRHGGAKVTPEQMQQLDPEVYDHCLGNFWGGVVQDILAARR